MGLMLRVGGLIGGMLLVVMAVGAQQLRPDPEDAYWVIVRDGDTLQLMMGDGSGRRLLDETVLAFHGERIWWSRDSQWMLHYYNQYGAGLRSVNVNQPDEEYQIDPGDVNGMGPPLFSPNGRWIIFEVPYRYPVLYRSRLDGSEKEQIRQEMECICFYGWTEHGQIRSMGNWGGEGELLPAGDNSIKGRGFGPQFEELETDEPNLLIGHNPDGIFQLSLWGGIVVEAEQLTPEGYRYTVLDYLPSGWILFTLGSYPNRPEGEYESGVYKIRPDGSQMEKLLEVDINSQYFNWSADGQWIYYASPYGYARKKIDGYLTQVLFARSVIPYGVPVWTSDHEWLVFTADIGDGMQLYKMRSNGGRSSVVISAAD